jgi:hypothetical protein
MIKGIAKLIFTIWQSRQPHHGYGHGKPWKPTRRKHDKHGLNWSHHGYPPYGHDYGYPGYHRSQGVKGLIIDAVLRRLLHRR